MGPFLGIVNKGVAAMGMLTKTLGQMDGDSKFIKKMSKSQEVIYTRYYVVAGNAAEYAKVAEDMGFMEKIELAVGKLVYWNTPNDIAVSISSIRNIAKCYIIMTVQVSAHHLNYFDDTNSLDVLKDMMR